ncbi:hypothetical protein BDR26DRAFT_122390 [Obelidium mucronatum]|nr:hypothetical protein BDR26DRAFT_122390 [Obelidium mucronatum]
MPHSFRCVQCDQFVDASSACAFHPKKGAESGRERDALLACAGGCGGGGCLSGSHRATHHADYGYSSFFADANELLDAHKIFTTVAATNAFAVFGLTDHLHKTHPNHLFLYLTPNGRSHPAQRVLFFSANHLAFVSLRASMSIIYSAGSRENSLRAANVTYYTISSGFVG